jgi:serine/threonine-protein kinase
VVNEEPTPLSTYRTDLPELIEKIVLRGLEKRPERRYHSGLEMASDLSMAFTHLEQPQEDISINDKFNNLRELDFFRGFPDSEIWEIVRASVWLEADAGEAIVREGDLDDSFFIITAGRVTVSKQGAFVGALDAGACFGEMGHINKSRRTATVTADTPVSLMKANSTLIEQVTSDCQLRFYKVFLRVLIDRLARTTEMLVADQS